MSDSKRYDLVDDGQVSLGIGEHPHGKYMLVSDHERDKTAAVQAERERCRQLLADVNIEMGRLAAAAHTEQQREKLAGNSVKEDHWRGRVVAYIDAAVRIDLALATIHASQTNAADACVQAKIDARVLRGQLDELEQETQSLRQENEKLNAMRTHCPDCGWDYVATGVETGCPCRLKDRVAELEAELGMLKMGLQPEKEQTQ